MKCEINGIYVYFENITVFNEKLKLRGKIREHKHWGQIENLGSLKIL